MTALPEMWTPDRGLEVDAVCPICLDFYSNPVYLSCAHVFCFDCTKNWTAQGAEDLTLSCPLCREENKRPILYEWMIRELIILIKQHGPLLKQHMGQITGPLGFCSEDTALETETGDFSLGPSSGLSDVCRDLLSVLSYKTQDHHPMCGPIHNGLDASPQRFTPLAGVLDSSNVSLVCPEVDVGKRKKWTSGVCKEPVSRRNPTITWWKIPKDLLPWSLSCTTHTSPWSARKLMWGKGKRMLQVFVRSSSGEETLDITWWKILGESLNWPVSWTVPTSPPSGICKLTWEREMQRILSAPPLWTLQSHSFVLNSQGKVTVVPCGGDTLCTLINLPEDQRTETAARLDIEAREWWHTPLTPSLRRQRSSASL